MRQDLSFQFRLGHALLAILCLLFLSCIQSESTTCPSGLLCASGMKCAARQDACILDDCGDGVIQPGEACDDGNITGADGCSPDCKSLELCGNDIVDTAVHENCDDGNAIGSDGCSADCKSNEECGNDFVDADETCDDGNHDDGDGCSADCQSDETCGNDLIDIDESCDDGNQVNGDGCSADCQSDESCGNGILDPGEVCDDGNEESGDGCSATCASEECGNQVVDANETCDDGNKVGGDGCSAVCRAEEGCGNGIKNANEECDDGNYFNDDDCLSSCVLARCGDGFMDQTPPVIEECDDGNALACGTCGQGCQVRQDSSIASGYFEAVEGGLIADGEIFSISDGRARLFFEFNKTGQVPDSHVEVSIGDGTAARGVAWAMAVAITKQISNGKLDIQVTGPGDKDALVRLDNVAPGTHGNQALIESVKDRGFLAEGMSEGAGHDCPEGTRCTRNEDCAGGDDGRIGKCKGGNADAGTVGSCILVRP
ncbi:DUF4215 domain-containing protein [Pyxidicoccus trucidator]|uniref:DUF4215 domain-containing protein n=1 Tax=Pyxidicoccus trucidator TaxID=2709662 RepID=UPI0013DC91B0|nr:DUF4215 domain-containing protein [Pyxidicoccus trucidator]